MSVLKGHTNASTGFERTTFHSVVPVGQLELVLWLEADRMGGLLDALTAESLDNQRDVVLNERRERYDNVPYGTGWEQLVAMSFPAGHPFRERPAGSPEDLRAVTLDDCRAFFGQHYAPDRAILSVVGDVDPFAVFELAERRPVAEAGSGPKIRHPDSADLWTWLGHRRPHPAPPRPTPRRGPTPALGTSRRTTPPHPRPIAGVRPSGESMCGGGWGFVFCVVQPGAAVGESGACGPRLWPPRLCRRGWCS